MSASIPFRAIVYVFAVASSLLHFSCVMNDPAKYLKSGVAGYTGDGTIRDTSQPGGAFPSHGYLIRFDTFDLSKPYEQTFHLEHLPIVGQRKAGIYFVVDNALSANRELERSASIDILLTTAAQGEVTHVKSRLSDLIWASPVHGYSGNALYDSNNSFFLPQPGERYRLHVKYLPSPAARSAKGYVYVWCGVGGA
jgi:hypothetical protein